MKVLIVEDELPAARRLARLLALAEPEAYIVAQLESIAEAEEWFAANPPPDLLLLDIHLADGSAFELLRRVQIHAPVIFTTAYDQYAVEAFKTLSVDYLLKPVKEEELAAALEKLRSMRRMLQSAPDFPTVAAEEKEAYRSRFMIRLGERIHTLPVEDIAYCFSSNKSTFARTAAGRTYPMDYNLDALEPLLDPAQFFRLNRQYLANIQAIETMRAHTKARVMVTLQPPAGAPLVVSSERAAAFKKWLGS